MDGFEEKLKRLEEIADLMRGESLELNEASSLFQEGIKLAQGLEKELSKIEGKIEQLINEDPKSDDKPVLELFPELDSEKP